MTHRDTPGSLAWAHIGDLHLTEEREANYQDFLSIVDSLNTNLAEHIDFCVLPGDNANEGSPAQYALIRRGLDQLRIPVHVIPGDHDRVSGSLRAFYRGLGVPHLPYAMTAGGCRCVFLDVVSAGNGGPDFALGAQQLAWLESELKAAAAKHEPCVVFMHAYPKDLKTDGDNLRQLLREHRVRLVDMGHTHYNELANDGTTIFATTRSTGQVEEGPVGFSIVCLNDGVVSWRFKPVASAWPFVMITSPADHRLLTEVENPAQLVTGRFTVRAKVFGSGPGLTCRCSINGGDWTPFQRKAEQWEVICQAPPQLFTLTVEATDHRRQSDSDTVVVAVPGHRFPHRIADGSDSDAIGEWPERHLLGTRLGPNRNGKQW